MTWLGLFGYSRSIPDRASCAIAAAFASDNRDPNSGGVKSGDANSGGAKSDGAVDGAGDGGSPEGRAGDAGRVPAASARVADMQKRRRLDAVGSGTSEVVS